MSQLGTGVNYNPNNPAASVGPGSAPAGQYWNAGDLASLPSGPGQQSAAGNLGAVLGPGWQQIIAGMGLGQTPVQDPGVAGDPGDDPAADPAGAIGGGGSVQGQGTVTGNAGATSSGNYYGPNSYDSGTPQQSYYDPTGGMGYGGAYSYSPLGGGMLQSPSQLGAISSQYAAQQGAQGQIGAAQAGAQGQVGAAQAGAQGQIGAATQAADASKLASQLGLEGTQGTNATNQNIAGINSQTQLGLGQLGLQGTQTTAGDQLQGTQATAAAQLAAAQAAADASKSVATTQTAPSLLKAQALTNLLSGGGGILGQLSGLGGSSGASGGSGGATGGVLNGGVLAGLGLTPGSQPAVPTATPFNSEQTQQNLGAGQAKIDQQLDTLRNNLMQSRGGSAGMNTTGGLPPGLEMQLQQQGMAAGNENNLNWENFANQTNNQNNLAYGGVALNQYNSNLQNELAALGLSANAEGSLIGALS